MMSIAKEKITFGSDTLVDRDASTFMFGDQKLPSMKSTESALSLISDEVVRPLFKSLYVVLHSKALSKPVRAAREVVYQDDKGQKTFSHINALREDKKLSLIQKAFYLMMDFQELFDAVKAHYKDIFTTVED